MNIADTEELTALLNDVLSHRETMSSSTASVSDTLSYVSVPPSPKGHPPTYAMSCLIPTPPQAHLSQTMCGLPGSQQRCQPKKNNKNSRGESVVITITPLPYFNSRRSSSQSLPDPTSPTTTTTTTTRVVTCHCGPSCTCLGCFVHPNNLYFPTEIVDPFAGFLHHPISSASSMYSSDDESLHIMGM
ncbi:hypothetical protein J3Q64DRAFT_1642760 [Phycomyces blakesleeanus]|uniref:Copper-fist domain-containing protein n=1 Tax=Phycomyces blakesleeanus TaxID=4837 RepID=A0ABR3AUT7_PHYBL